MTFGYHDDNNNDSTIRYYWTLYYNNTSLSYKCARTYNVIIYKAYDVPRHQSFTKISHVHYWPRRRVKFGCILYIARWCAGRLSDFYQNPSRMYLTFAVSKFNVIVSSCILLLGIIWWWAKSSLRIDN